MGMKIYAMEEIENLRLHGRISRRQTPGVPLFWTGACVEVNVTGSKLFLHYTCFEDAGEAYLRVEVDGFDLLRFPLEAGEHRVLLLSGFGGFTKNVRIFRENQASGTVVLIRALETDGEFLPVEQRRLIEFIGDSVTSGEGLAGAVNMKNWVPAVFSCRNNYALLTANALHADWSILSQSGWGIYCSWDNNVTCAMPLYYEGVASMQKSERNRALGSTDAYDFARRADAVVINLGANDSSAMNEENPAWTDETGTVWHLHTENGRADAETWARIKNAYVGFMEAVREKNPGALIVLGINMFGNRNGIADIARDAFAEYLSRHPGDRSVLAELPAFDGVHGVGARSHPGKEMHEKFAEALVKVISEHWEG